MESATLSLLIGEERKETTASGFIVVGRLVELDALGRPWVDYEGNERGPLLARTILAELPNHRESGSTPIQVLIGFENSNASRPVVLGIVRESLPPGPVSQGAPLDLTPAPQLVIDVQRFMVEAGREIVLRCGKSSITLRADGKIIVQGTNLLNQASGVNRIKGGAVHIN